MELKKASKLNSPSYTPPPTFKPSATSTTPIWFIPNNVSAIFYLFLRAVPRILVPLGAGRNETIASKRFAVV
jgi:hypothetical protein